MMLVLNSSTQLQLAAALTAASGSVIFHGPIGVGKFTAAIEWIRTKNCQSDGAENCTCRHCIELRAGVFPDLIVIRPETKSSIGVEVVRDLISRLNLAPYYSKSQRFIVIDQAESLTHQAQNALLKLIEEPPARTNIILVATNLESLLVTIRSRCSQAYFPALATQALSDWLISERDLSPSEAKAYAEVSNGAAGVAIQLLTDTTRRDDVLELVSLIEQFYAGTLFDRIKLAKVFFERKADYSEIIRQLFQQGRELEMTDSPRRQNVLGGLELLHLQLNANVSPRGAFERFAIGLSG